MSSLASLILAFLIGITTTFLYIIIFKSTPVLEQEQAVFNASNLVKLPNISLSTTFVESRILEYQDYSNDFYLGMKKDSFAGFVYAK